MCPSFQPHIDGPYVLTTPLLTDQGIYMVRHILLVRFKPGASPPSIEVLQSAFKSMPSKIEGLVDVEWGENNSPENKNMRVHTLYPDDFYR